MRIRVGSYEALYGSLEIKYLVQNFIRINITTVFRHVFSAGGGTNHVYVHAINILQL